MSKLGRRKSGWDRVSRAPHELSAARNCTRDEGGPFEFGDQEPISSHRKPLRTKAVVVSVAETPGQRFRPPCRLVVALEPRRRQRQPLRIMPQSLLQPCTDTP